MTYSLIIPTRDRADLLGRLLDSLERHCPPRGREVVIVRTGDGYERGLEPYRVVGYRGATFAQAVNYGVREAKGEFLILLNDDLILQDDIIAAFRLAALGHPNAIIGARLLYPDGLVQHAGIGFDTGGAPYNLWRLAPGEHAQVLQRRRLPAVTFACARVPRHVWLALGGLDEGYTNSFEDVDFCLRATEAGYPVFYDPNVTATHLEGQSQGRGDGIEASWRHYQDIWLATGRVQPALGVWPFSVRR